VISTIQQLCADSPPLFYPYVIDGLIRAVAAQRQLPRRLLEIGIGMGHGHARYHKVAAEVESLQGFPFEVWGIDNGSWVNFRAHFMQNLESIRALEREPRLLLMDSRDAGLLLAGVMFGIVFVDGDHSYELAYNDIRTYGALVPSGGIVIVHDAQPGLGPSNAIQDCADMFTASHLDDRYNPDHDVAVWYGIRK